MQKQSPAMATRPTRCRRSGNTSVWLRRLACPPTALAIRCITTQETGLQKGVVLFPVPIICVSMKRTVGHEDGTHSGKKMTYFSPGVGGSAIALRAGD